MTRSPGYCGVILAAGTPERLSTGLSPWPQGNAIGTTLLSNHIKSLNAVSELVLVVASSDESPVAPTVYAHGGFLVSTMETDSDFSNLQIGVFEVLNRGRDTAIIVPVDMLPLSATSYRLLCDAYQLSDRDVWAVIPKSSEPSVYPIIAGRELIEEILRAPSESNLGEVLSTNAAHVLAVEIDEHPVSGTLAQHNS